MCAADFPVLSGSATFRSMSLSLGSEKIPLQRDDRGVIRVGSTRVSLESVAYAFEEGDSPEAIQEAFPSLSLSDIYLVLGYCLKHPEDLAEYLAEQRQFNAKARQEDESRFQTEGLRARLLQRKRERNSA